MAEQRIARRIRRRMACELKADGRQQRAIVIDLSHTGLFVQTSARLSPGTQVELLLQFEGDREPLLLRAAVARQKAVPSNLTSVAQGGIGLRIVDAPRAYYELVGETAAPVPAAAPTIPPASSPRPPMPAADPKTAPEAPPSSPPRFRVRVKQSDGPRSRILDIAAETAERASAAALAQVGAGWEALGAERV
ncbi:MAG: PilZ domain-containing protein [Deltaproteobacteria bacterium]|nr:PilZ domain-containing protein [Deltaproteobacteria bacterium]